ncbi:hypothetical protein LCGC14_1240120 [marine sediment metagenome]|uniref:Uncharacterized protein n=1 Tax=marine sediment metagenome TaxID=412755 RepID=A0A0F9LTA4_9ZZZZ
MKCLICGEAKIVETNVCCDGCYGTYGAGLNADIIGGLLTGVGILNKHPSEWYGAVETLKCAIAVIERLRNGLIEIADKIDKIPANDPAQHDALVAVAMKANALTG